MHKSKSKAPPVARRDRWATLKFQIKARATRPEVKQINEAWRREYYESRPHRALGERTPNEFASEFAASRELTGPPTAENSLSR